MRSDWDTYQKHRDRVLKDLQVVFRRANSTTPVMNPEDMGIIRNTVGPAMSHQKFGEAGTLYFGTSPIMLAYLTKEAWGWGDIWGGVKSIASGVGEGISGVGSALKNVALAPWNIGKGIYEGATSEGPWYSRVGQALGGAVEGAFRPVSDLGGAAYSAVRGTVKGVGQATGLAEVDALRNAAQAVDPYARFAFRDILPTVGMMLLPGGQAAGAARIAGTAGRLSRMGQSIGGALRMAEAPAAAARATGVAGRVGRGLRSMVAPTAGEAQAVGQTARGFGQAVRGLVKAPSVAGAGEVVRSGLGTYAQTYRNLAVPAYTATMAANLPTIIPAVQEHGWGILNPVQPEGAPPSPVTPVIRGAARGLMAEAPEQPSPARVPYGQLQSPGQPQAATSTQTGQQPNYAGYGMGQSPSEHVVV